MRRIKTVPKRLLEKTVTSTSAKKPSPPLPRQKRCPAFSRGKRPGRESHIRNRALSPLRSPVKSLRRGQHRKNKVRCACMSAIREKASRSPPCIASRYPAGPPSRQLSRPGLRWARLAPAENAVALAPLAANSLPRSRSSKRESASARSGGAARGLPGRAAVRSSLAQKGSRASRPHPIRATVPLPPSLRPPATARFAHAGGKPPSRRRRLQNQHQESALPRAA